MGKRRLSHCPACGGLLVSHLEGCRIDALRGVCAACHGSRVVDRKPCEECGGTGEAPRGNRDASYYAAIEIDAESHRIMEPSR